MATTFISEAQAAVLAGHPVPLRPDRKTGAARSRPATFDDRLAAVWAEAHETAETELGLAGKFFGDPPRANKLMAALEALPPDATVDEMRTVATGAIDAIKPAK